MTTWYRIPDGTTAHAFREGPGWLRSACASVHWSVRLRPVSERVPRCRACLAVLEMGRPIEPAMEETEAAAAWGDR
jgi:hypothetical protein